jgi:hypothetical protein
MELGYWKRWEFPSQGDASVRELLIAAFDALHGIAHVNWISATEEMARAGIGRTEISAWKVMSQVGDLTNPPEQTAIEIICQQHEDAP